MPHLLLLILIGVVLVAVLGRLIAPPVSRAMDKVLAGGDVEPLVKEISALRASAQPDAFNSAIRRLWDDYQRERTIPLIRALAEAHAGTRIAQYWLERLRTVEPELAATLGEEFFAAHYQPEVAASCGSSG